MNLSSLFSSGPVLTDGAWGTELQKRGLESGACPDAWNLFRPDTVMEVAQAYVDAGSQLILTNTFRANRITLQEYGLDADVMAINRTGAEISQRAARGKARVFASMGPTGKMLAAGEIS